MHKYEHKFELIYVNQIDFEQTKDLLTKNILCCKYFVHISLHGLIEFSFILNVFT